MSLRATLSASVESTFNVIDSILVDFTYVRQDNTTYNTATGVVSEGSTSFPVRGLFGKYTDEDIARSGSLFANLNINASDPTIRKLIFPISRLKGVVPSLVDYVIIKKIRWDIFELRQDASDLVQVLGIKKSG